MTEIDISTQLRKLVSIQLMHQYFGDAQYRDMVLQPTLETARLFQNYKLVFKPLSINGFAGGVVMYSPQLTPELFMRETWRPEKFTFLLLNENMRFLNFTRMPFYGKGRGFHVHTLGAKYTEGGKIFLHESSTLQSELEQPVIFVPRIFQFASNDGQPIVAKDIIVKDVWGEEIKLPAPDEEDEQGTQRHNEAQPSVMIDLSNVPVGKYIIHTNKADKKGTSVYAMDDSIPANLVGVIDLYLDPPGVDRSVFDAKAKEPERVITTRDFVLQFEARATHWRYVLINPRETKYGDYKITNTGKGGELSFDTAEEVQLQDKPMSQGTAAMRMVSSAAVPLREFPPFRLELSAKKNLNGKRASFKLPLPSVDRIKSDSTEKDKYYSDVYVYI